MAISDQTKHLPPPIWWKAAQMMAAGGMRPTDIARELGRSVQGVRYAINPAHREAQRASATRNRKPLTAEQKKAKADTVRADYQRLNARREARAQWRAGGCKTSLTMIYRRLDCL
jgi:copper oxidase (laccase) domain-containing protein